MAGHHFKFGSNSEKNLIGVHKDLVAVVRQALIETNIDFGVIEGVRTKQRQQELYAQGRTKPGKIVTWTLNSRHITGHAVDLWPVNPSTGKLDPNYAEGFTEIVRAMAVASGKLGIPVTSGHDWDHDAIYKEKGETDGPHFELRKGFYP